MSLSNSSLKSGIKVSQKILNNSQIAYDNADYLTIYNHNGRLIFQAVGDKNALFLNVAPTSEEINVNIDNKKIHAVLANLDEEVELKQEGNSLEINDGSAKVKLVSYAMDGFDIDVSEVMGLKEEAKRYGRKVNRSEFLNILSYLYSQLTKGDEEEVMGDIYFGETTSYIFSDRYAVQTRYTLPYELIIGMESASVLIELLKADKGEDILIFKRGEGDIDFIVGDSYYQVTGMNTLFNSRLPQMFRNFQTNEKLTLDVNEFRKFAELAKNFLEDDEREIVLSVEDGIGQVSSDSASDNGSNGTFEATGIDEIDFTLDVFEVLKTISIIKEGDLTFQINEDIDQALIEHKKGKIILSISER